MNALNLRRLLGRVRRWQLLSELSRHLGWASTVLLTTSLIAVALDAAVGLPVGGLIAVDVPLVVLALAAGIYVGRGGLRGRCDNRHLARLIEERLGIGDSRLINALDFSDGRADGSRELIEQSLRGGDSLAASIEPRQVIDSRRLRRALLAGGAALTLTAGSCLLTPALFQTVLTRYLDPWGDHPAFTLQQFDVRVEPQRVFYGRPATIRASVAGPHPPDQATVVVIDGGSRRRVPMVPGDASASSSSRTGMQRTFVLPVARAEKSLEFYVDTPSGRSERHKLNIEAVPLFERVKVHYTYPAYTHWPDSENQLTEQGIHGLQGTQVTLSVKSNLPLRGGQLVLTPDTVDTAPATLPANPGRTVLLQPDTTDATTVVGQFPLDFSGRYTLTLTGADGTPGLEPLAGTLTAAADQQPQVEIVGLQPMIAAVENWKVPVAITAQDDVGVTGVQLTRSAGPGNAETVDLKLDAPNAGHVDAAYEFDLKAMGAKPGDVIKYSAQVRDGFPAGGASGHAAESPTFSIQVISMADYLRLAGGQYPTEDLTVPAGSLGGEGAASGGGKGRVLVLGPHQAGGQPAATGGTGPTPRGQEPGTAIRSQGVGVETLNPATATNRTGGGANLQGVPAQYVDQVEAYFQRLAGDSKQ